MFGHFDRKDNVFPVKYAHPRGNNMTDSAIATSWRSTGRWSGPGFRQKAFTKPGGRYSHEDLPGYPEMAVSI